MIYLTTTINLSQVVMYNQLYSRKKIQNYVAVKHETQNMTLL